MHHQPSRLSEAVWHDARRDIVGEMVSLSLSIVSRCRSVWKVSIGDSPVEVSASSGVHLRDSNALVGYGGGLRCGSKKCTRQWIEQEMLA